MMKEGKYLRKRNLVRQKKCITGLDDEGGCVIIVSIAPLQDEVFSERK